MDVLRTGYRTGYLSINSILATDINFLCHINKEIRLEALVTPEYLSEDLKPGSEVKLPFWVAEALCRSSGGPNEPNYISILDFPTFLKEGILEIIESDPKSVDLRRFHHHYYEAGRTCSMLRHKDAAKLADIMFEILEQRVIAIGYKTIDEPDHLDELELKLAEDWNQNLIMMDEYLFPLTNVQTVLQLSPKKVLKMRDTKPSIFHGKGTLKLANLSEPFPTGEDMDEAAEHTCATTSDNNDTQTTPISFPDELSGTEPEIIMERMCFEL